MRSVRSKKLIDIAPFVAMLAGAAIMRFSVAPMSAGPDVAQFWAFAKVFHLHGLDFYRYADASLEIFPFYGWPFVYPPVWLLIIGLMLWFVPSSSATSLMVDAGWRVAMKAPIIAADLAIGGLLYWAVPGSKSRKLLFSSLWLLHPTGWYESGVYGQFDAIAGALLLGAVILLTRGTDRWAFVLAGLAVMTKQHTLASVAMLVVISARYMERRRLLKDCLLAAGVALSLSIPFTLGGNLMDYARSVFLPGWAPAYQYPLCFSLSGSGALLTHLHNVFEWDTLGVMQLTVPVLALALVAAAVLGYRTQLSPLQGALAGFLIFVSASYQVHYQYLVVYLPLAILLASQARYLSEKVSALILVALPAAWLWLANVPWWFNYLEPTSPWVTPVLANIGLYRRYLPDYAYVLFAVALMYLAVAHVVLTYGWWRQGSGTEPAARGDVSHADD